jgi:hypothetical protein
VVSIIATNKSNKQEYTFVPNTKTGKYVISLPPGNYDIQAFADGYVTLKETLTVSDIGRVEMIKSKNILFQKK